MQMILCLCLIIVLNCWVVCQRLLRFYQDRFPWIFILAKYLSKRLHQVLIFLDGCIFHIIEYRGQRQVSGCINGFTIVLIVSRSRHISVYCRTAMRMNCREKWRTWGGYFRWRNKSPRQNFLNALGYWAYAVQSRTWARGGIGIRKGLKIPGRKACGFDSHRAHHVKRLANARRFAFASRGTAVSGTSRLHAYFLLAHLNRLCFTESTRL